jgi:hypothetical protein
VADYSQFSIPELRAESAALKKRLKNVEKAIDVLELSVDAEGRRLKKVAWKLGLTSSGVLAGILATPLTLGWALAAASLPAVTAAWEMNDFARDYQRLRPLRQRLKALRRESDKLKTRLVAVYRERKAQG